MNLLQKKVVGLPAGRQVQIPPTAPGNSCLPGVAPAGRSRVGDTITIGVFVFLLQQLTLHISGLPWRHEKPPRLPTRSHESSAR